MGRWVFTSAKLLNRYFCKKYLIFWLILHVLTPMCTHSDPINQLRGEYISLSLFATFILLEVIYGTNLEKN